MNPVIINEERCENCKFFHKGNAPHGECRRTPPVPNMVQMVNKLDGQSVNTVISYWPPTQFSNWCGEWSVDLRS